ncbi:methyltransferase [Halioglobus japonicus]|uniref:Methyltransferase n=1 Tax=Halioglobus japonicus TaxID=930805 RepID=A0AAP8SPK8_9GAMM|nr:MULTISPECIES: 50S ribosomal protein L11 methyltransferase [Halioglobus]AQA19340.1 methyltransferase [Halioglobus japonicus]KZX59164.1 methyltransferase [Halioglobus sp. HI00S01]PLW87614.1 methyltransferase [Halioglobus japonicus]GHD07535.1 methyltransferase [Halioglobus japonicus]
MSPDRENLEARLRDILPSAHLEVMPLPDAPELRLLLLAEDYPRQVLNRQEMWAVMDSPLYWIFCWASGQVLARYILDHPEQVAGKRVLDFGCGSGVVAVAAAMAGAREVVACDIDPLAIAATQFNAQLNDVSLVLAEDYFDVQDDIDLIIVADVLYDRENFPWLERFVARAPHVLIADSRVKNFDHPPYRAIDRRQSCTIPDLDESAEFRDVRIYQAIR